MNIRTAVHASSYEGSTLRCVKRAHYLSLLERGKFLAIVWPTRDSECAVADHKQSRAKTPVTPMELTARSRIE